MSTSYSAKSVRKVLLVLEKLLSLVRNVEIECSTKKTRTTTTTTTNRTIISTKTNVKRRRHLKTSIQHRPQSEMNICLDLFKNDDTAYRSNCYLKCFCRCSSCRCRCCSSSCNRDSKCDVKKRSKFKLKFKFNLSDRLIANLCLFIFISTLVGLYMYPMDWIL